MILKLKGNTKVQWKRILFLSLVLFVLNTLVSALVTVYMGGVSSENISELTLNTHFATLFVSILFYVVCVRFLQSSPLISSFIIGALSYLIGSATTVLIMGELIFLSYFVYEFSAYILSVWVGVSLGKKLW